MSTAILGIESSCDDTSAAVIVDGILRSNVIAGQKVHEAYGGVVHELASRAHQQNIVPVVSEALRQADIKKEDLSAIAYTRGGITRIVACRYVFCKRNGYRTRHPFNRCQSPACPCSFPLH